MPAGFPSPADDYVEQTLDLNEHLIRRETSTFFVRVVGDSMTDAGVHDDILAVNRAVEPTDGAIVVAALDSELTVKRYSQRDGAPYLGPGEEGLADIRIVNAIMTSDRKDGARIAL